MGDVERYQRPVSTIAAEASVLEVADRMRADEVGSVVVLDGERPIGIVTDRDLLKRVIVADADSGKTRARDVMSVPLISVTPDADLEVLVGLMAEHAIRRVPIVDHDRLLGMASLDDLLSDLAEEIGDLSEGVQREVRGAASRARARHVARDAEALARDVGTRVERMGQRAAHGVGRATRVVREQVRSWISSHSGPR